MKKKTYLVLDTETATLPFANDLCKDAEQKKKIAIAKPLVYDIGWVITDRQGNVYKKVNYLVQETFFVPQIFNTAYYVNKRPIYFDLLSKGLIQVKCWNDIMVELKTDLDNCDIATAYNACFDFKKAIPFTEQYIQNLYSVNYNAWEQYQYSRCQEIISGTDESKNPDYLTPIFNFRNSEYPLCDLWGLSCNRLINKEKYKNYCLKNNLLTSSAMYFKTSAETCFQYVMKEYQFVEDHTALSDAEIESKILIKALKKGKIEPSIDAFPFRDLGTTYDYVLEQKTEYINVVKDAMTQYYNGLAETGFKTKIGNILQKME